MTSSKLMNLNLDLAALRSVQSNNVILCTISNSTRTKLFFTFVDSDLLKIFRAPPPSLGELSVNFFFSANQKYLPDVALTQTFNWSTKEQILHLVKIQWKRLRRGGLLCPTSAATGARQAPPPILNRQVQIKKTSFLEWTLKNECKTKLTCLFYS